MARLSVVVCVIFTCAVSGAALPYRLTGQKVSLNPDITGTQQPDEILWKHNGNKVVEFNGRTQQVFGLFKNRVTLDLITADLTIENLRPDDSGEYDVEVFRKKKLSRKTFQFVVLDDVSKPNIMCERRKGGSSTDGEQATLTCSAESRQPQTLTYEWIPHGVGPRLTISLSDKNKEYICTVTNPLTSASAKFTAKDCYPDQGVPVPLIACLSLAVILIIALVVGIVFCKKKNKGLNNEAPENEENKCHDEPIIPPGTVNKLIMKFEGNPNETRTVQKRKMQFEGNPNKTTPQKQTDEDVGVKSPPANKVTPPVPMPRMRQQQIPPVGAEDITDISVCDETNPGNDQFLSPPSPEKPDQSKSGELQESPDATYSELDQQNQDNARRDSPEKQLDSDMAKGKKGEDEGDTDENEDKERRNKDTEEAKLEKQSEENEDEDNVSE